jgi:hypothetical protein
VLALLPQLLEEVQRRGALLRPSTWDALWLSLPALRTFRMFHSRQTWLCWQPRPLEPWQLVVLANLHLGLPPSLAQDAGEEGEEEEEGQGRRPGWFQETHKQLASAAMPGLLGLLRGARCPLEASATARALGHLVAPGAASDAAPVLFAACISWATAGEQPSMVAAACPGPAQAPVRAGALAAADATTVLAAPAAPAVTAAPAAPAAPADEPEQPEQQQQACMDALLEAFDQVLAACCKGLRRGYGCSNPAIPLLLALLQRCCRMQPGSARLLPLLAQHLAELAGAALFECKLGEQARARLQQQLEPLGPLPEQQLPALHQLLGPLPPLPPRDEPVEVLQEREQQEGQPREGQPSETARCLASVLADLVHCLAANMLVAVEPSARSNPQLLQALGSSGDVPAPAEQAASLAAVLGALATGRHAREAQAAADSAALLPRLWQLWSGCPDAQLQRCTCEALHSLRWLAGGQLRQLGAHTFLARTIEVGGVERSPGW